MTKPDDKRGQVSITMLVPASTVEQLDLYVEEFKHCNPGREFNRADALRSILGMWQTQRVNKQKQLAQRAEKPTTPTRVLPPCEREGKDGDWWTQRHVYCTGSEHLGGVEVRCSCKCHDKGVVR